jgi:hypothetical protein
VAEKHPRCPHYVIGLDLGQASDYTALCVMDRHVQKVGEPYMHRYYGGAWQSEELAELRTTAKHVMTVRYLDRPPLRTSYTRIVDGVLDRINALFPVADYPKGGEVVLVIDGTGVGRGIADMFYRRIPERDMKARVALWPCTITGGTGRSTADKGFISLPKHELIHTGGVIPMQDGRLKWGPRIKNRDVLEQELLTYTKKINIATGSTQFEPWREKEHDDLLFALCLAGWGWNKFQRKYVIEHRGEEYVPPAPEPAGHSPITGAALPPLP